MRRALVGVLLIALSGLAALSGGSPAHGATNALCDEPNGHEVNANVSGNVNVPANGVCHIHGWTINGNVTVAQGGKLFTRNSTVIHGSVIATNPTQVNIEDNTVIDGNFTASGPGTGTPPYGGFICGSTVRGNVLVQNFTASDPGWVIGQPTTPPPDGYVYYGGGTNDPDLTCESPNVIGGNVTFLNNSVKRLKVAANTIGNPKASNIVISGNTVVNENIKVEANTVWGNISCSGNTWTGGTPPVTNEGLTNSVHGSETGQCVGL